MNQPKKVLVHSSNFFKDQILKHLTDAISKIHIAANAFHSIINQKYKLRCNN